MSDFCHDTKVDEPKYLHIVVKNPNDQHVNIAVARFMGLMNNIPVYEIVDESMLTTQAAVALAIERNSNHK